MTFNSHQFYEQPPFLLRKFFEASVLSYYIGLTSQASAETLKFLLRISICSLLPPRVVTYAPFVDAFLHVEKYLLLAL